MALVKIDWNPTDKDLRNFGRIAIIAVLLIATVLHMWKDLALLWCAIIVGLGFFIFLCSILSLKLTRWIYLGLTLITFPIGMTVSFIMLGLFYYLLLTPVGLVFRLMGRDALHRRFDSSAASYWRQRRPPEGMKRYFNQF
jgi:hypothetical protein